MPTLEEIKKQMKELDGIDKFLARGEIKELPDILWEDEKVEKITGGLYNNGNGLLVGTNKRVIFIDKGLIGLKVEDFPYNKITSIEYKTGIILGEIKMYCAGNKANIEQVNNKEARNFSEYVRARITENKEHGSFSKSSTQSSSEDVVSQLERLAKLKEQGILTKEEFLAQKKKILES